MNVIEVQNVSKVYPARRGTRVMLGRGGLGDWLRGRTTGEFAALRDISIEVGAGESLGIIGRNGSGKSTLLKIMAGVTLPSSGDVTIRGRVASLLELGAGFHPMLTGRENVYLNAGLLGMRHGQVDEVFDQIVAFSGIADFIDQPVDTYSSGMYVRIGFAVASHTNPDVFLVDEVLSVGDEEFQRKCRRRIGELREQGKTIVFVSHDLGIVNTLCNRIVLLDKGRMIVRDTPQKTINFYLRQVGRELGTHTFSEGRTEAIQCDGRISLFQDQDEITAGNGLQLYLSSLGQRHSSRDADWEVAERTETGCAARGRMTRLPVELAWKMELRDGKLHWHIAMDCEHDTALTQIEAVLHLPVAFAQWVYGDFSGAFPNIQPSDAAWNVMAAPEVFESEAAALPSPGSALPALVCRLASHDRRFGFYWANSEYASFSRMLIAYARFPQENCIFPKGKHELMTFTVDMTVPREEVNSRVRSDRVLEAGALQARFEQGKIRLRSGGDEISAFLHVYSAMLIEQLWQDSTSLQWTPPRPEGNGLVVTGESRRFPFRQEWRIERLDNALGLTITMDVLEPFDAQEYHVSAVLRPEYERWETDTESGVFPPFDPASGVWRHLNKSYAPGRSARALSSSLPSVMLESTAEQPTFRMTAINTRPDQNARVLQALRAAEAGTIHFEAGRHVLFSGIIRVASPMPPNSPME